MASLKTVFDSHCNGIQVNTGLFRRVKKYHDSLFNKDEDTMSFFGDGLWGVYPIYYDKSEINTWFDDIMEVDDIGLRHEVHDLPTINPSHKVSSNVLNLSMFYLTHLVVTGKSLSQRDTIALATLIMRILHFRFLTSLQGHYFRYKADKSVALAVYASLSMRYSIKCHGSWGKLIESRAEDILSSRSIHRTALQRFGGDDQIIYMVNDIQGRIRDVCKKLSAEFYRLRDMEAGIDTSSLVRSSEEGEFISDTVKDYNIYRQYSNRVLSDRGTLIRKEILDVVDRFTHRLPQGTLETTLEWITNNNEGTSGKLISEWLDALLGHAFSVMEQNKLKTNQITHILAKLRSVYLASRTSDDRLILAKELGMKIVSQALSDRSEQVKSTVRIALMLYVVIRTLAKKYYT